jgi:hypothetical protein
VVIYVRGRRIGDAKAAVAEWLKTRPHSALSKSRMPLREPMKQKYLDNLRKAGMPERADRTSP